MDNIKFILVEEESVYNCMIDTMFSDAFLTGNLKKVIETYDFGTITKILKREKIINYIGDLTSFYMKKKYELYKYLDKYLQKNEYLYIIFLNSSFHFTKYEYKTLLYYKKIYKNIKYILFYIDIVHHYVSKQANFLRKKKIFDLIYTVDEKDAKDYQMIYWPIPYSYKNETFLTIPENCSSEIYFCGATKKRTYILNHVAEAAQKNGIICEMDIVCDEKEGNLLGKYESVKLHPAGMYLYYDDILKKTLNCKCILDIVQPGQQALTLRAYEAVLYNKKLLSNNKSLISFQYYNPNYMQYFENVNDINWDWIKSNINIDYHYNGDFSPIKLLDDIKERCIKLYE